MTSKGEPWHTKEEEEEVHKMRRVVHGASRCYEGL